MIRTLFIIIALLVFNPGYGQNNRIVLGITDSIRSVQLSETRHLNIYLPPGYNSADTTHYAVIYLLDGGIDEDFIHVAGIVQFNTQEWVARIPQSIIVGITNTDRKRDMTFPTTIKADKVKYPTTGGSAKFISFLEKELKPYINNHYKTNWQSTLIGESLAGLLAVEVLVSKPSLFDKYIIISPSLWWDNGSLIRRSMDAPAREKKQTSVYLGVGKEGLAPTEEPHVMEVDANILKDKLDNLHNKNVSIFFDYLPDENHATVAHQAIFNAFRKLYPPQQVR